MTAHRLRHSLSRRGFLQLAACLSLSAPALGCAPSDGTVPGQSPFQVWLSLVSQQNDSAAPTAIVIGAGIAGLAAARQLQQDGLSVRILE
ncbi:MAG: NAD(P)-binding protein, partial [Caldilinea sp.]